MKIWTQTSHQWKQLFHSSFFFSPLSPRCLRSYRRHRRFFATCSASSSAAAEPSVNVTPSGRNRTRRPSSSSSTSDREAIRSIRLQKVRFPFVCLFFFNSQNTSFVGRTRVYSGSIDCEKRNLIF